MGARRTVSQAKSRCALLIVLELRRQFRQRRRVAHGFRLAAA